MIQSNLYLIVRAGNFALVRLFAVGVLPLFCADARATLYLNEPFDYPAGNLSAASPWTGAGSNLKMISGNLTNGGLSNPVPSSATKAQSLGSAADGKRTFNAIAVGGPGTDGSLYVSFLLRQTTLAASSGPLLALSDATSVGSTGIGALVVYLNKSGTQFQIGVKKDGSAVQYPTSGTYALNDTVLVVARYKFNTGSVNDDTVTLWINPALNGIEPAPGPTGIAETTVAGVADFTVGLQYLHLRANSSTASGINEVDNVRVGDTWADVTPTGTVVPLAAPYVTRVFLTSGGLVLRGTTFISVSMGMVTNFSSSSALRPGHCVMITTRVLITSGKASIGVLRKLRTPAIIMINVNKKIINLFFSEKLMMPLIKLFMARD